jgi:hypothetical protein
MQCSFADRAAVPAHQQEPTFAVEEEKEVREVKAHWAQGIAWPPPSPKRRTTVSAARSNAANSLSDRRDRQDKSRKVHLEILA